MRLGFYRRLHGKVASFGSGYVTGVICTILDNPGLEPYHDTQAIGRYGAPRVFNTDRGAQFMLAAFTGALKARGVRILMDGKGCWLDNVYVECFWRSLNQEEVYRHSYGTVREAQVGSSPMSATSTKNVRTRALTTSRSTTYTTDESR